MQQLEGCHQEGAATPGSTAPAPDHVPQTQAGALHQATTPSSMSDQHYEMLWFGLLLVGIGVVVVLFAML